MASLSFYGVLLVFFSVKITFQQITYYSGANKVKIANFFRKRSRKLAVPSLKSLEFADELKCLTNCVKTDECNSVNIRKLENENVMCDLLNRTMYHYPKKLAKSEGSSHWYNKLPISCKDILTRLPKAKSGLYRIFVNNHMVTVYCDMVFHGGGFTFIPKSAVKSGTLADLVAQLFTNKSEVLLYIQKKDGSQTFTHIQQLKEESQTPLVVLQNTNKGFTTSYRQPFNSFMGDYLYLKTSFHTNGFLSNNIEVRFDNNIFPIISWFAFFPNHGKQTPSTNHNHNLVFETQGVAVDWRNTGKVLTEKIPPNFFYLTEVRYGGGGCYTSSDRWHEANGTAIGLR